MILFSTINLNANLLRIEPTQLVNNLHSYTILDTRSVTLYEEGHIKKALNFPVNLTYEHKNINGKITNPIKMQNIIIKLGLNIDDNIAIYDDGTYFDSARLFWTLEVYGFKNVKILNTGYNNWMFNNYPTSTITPKVKQSNYIPKIDNKRLATKFTTQIATKNPNQVIIDARDKKSYQGKSSIAKRFGHILKAVHIPATHNINYENKSAKLKTVQDLKQLYKDIDKKQKVIIYCAIGRIASTNYFALRELGYNVSNYDASWKEWGNDFTLPINNPSKK